MEYMVRVALEEARIREIAKEVVLEELRRRDEGVAQMKANIARALAGGLGHVT